MWILINQLDNEPVRIGDSITDFRGEVTTLAGGEPPRSAASTGRVTTPCGGSYYPSVYNLKWVRQNG